MGITIKNIKIKPKLIGAFLIVGLIPLVVIGYLSMEKAKSGLMKQAFNQLESVQQIKQNQIKTFFQERIGDSKVLADNPTTKMAIAEFVNVNNAARKKGLGGKALLQDSKYNDVLNLYDRTFKYYMDTYGYYDVFLIGAEKGDVFYTVAKEADFGTELSMENTNLAEVWQKALSTGQPALSDMQPYAPSAGAPAMFVACPVVDEGKNIGVLGLQISTEAINAIMQERAGMGKTGETYLVGSNKLMRSDSFLDPTGHSIEASFKGNVQSNGVDTDAARNAIAGNSGIEVITDYNGNPVLSAYSPLELYGGVNWACIAEIDLAEVEEPIKAMRNSMVMIGVIISVIVALLALGVAVSIANPVKKMTEVAQSLAQGDFSQKIDIDQKDEIGQLAEAFRVMNEALKNLIETDGGMVLKTAPKKYLTKRLTGNYEDQYALMTDHINTVIQNLNEP